MDDPDGAEQMVVELTNDIPKDSTILQGLRATRGVRMTAETATSVFVKWPALANQRYVSLYTPVCFTLEYRVRLLRLTSSLTCPSCDVPH